MIGKKTAAYMDSERPDVSDYDEIFIHLIYEIRKLVDTQKPEGKKKPKWFIVFDKIITGQQ